LTIATLNDWYIPAYNELAILMYNLGPSWTTATVFQTGNTEAFAGGSNYFWTSTEWSAATTQAQVGFFAGASFNDIGKNSFGRARAVRRVAA
jgi:hypothetical protein